MTTSADKKTSKKEDKTSRVINTFSDTLLDQYKAQAKCKLLVLFFLPGCVECENIRSFLANTEELSDYDFAMINLREAQQSNLPELRHTRSYITSPVVEVIRENQMIGRYADLSSLLDGIELMKS